MLTYFLCGFWGLCCFLLFPGLAHFRFLLAHATYVFVQILLVFDLLRPEVS